MAASTQTFSETWHRIASSRVSIRPSVNVRRMHFRGERWYVLEDPFSNQFFRIRPAAYDFLARLDGNRTVEESWLESLEVHPDEAPGQEEVVQLLAQLFQGNLIKGDLSPDSAAAFQRYRKRRQKEIKTKLRSILFFRLPLFNPDQFLKRTLILGSWLFTRFGFLLWLGVIGYAVKVAIDNWPELLSSSQSVIAPSNLPLLYVSLVFIKLFHELGHGYACRKYGGEVTILGVMMLVFTPVPYVDASSSWRFKSKWQRITVASAGIYTELLIAAIAVFIWASTGAGLLHSLCYNLIFIASVSTILFNINPLLRFDGYYILSDLIGIPNLNQRANRQWKHLLEHRGFGIRRSVSPSNSKKEAVFYLFWGAAAWVYRLFLFTVILLFVADQFLILGVIIAITGVITWVVVPVFKSINYLVQSPRIERQRPRAIAVTLGLVALVVIPLCIIPFPNSFSAPGILRSVDYNVVFTQSSGAVADVNVKSGDMVKEGEVILKLSNQPLLLESEGIAARLEESRVRERQLLTRPGKGLDAIREQIFALENRKEEIESQLNNLEVRAPVSGIWVSPEIQHFPGVWVDKGTNLGEIVNPEDMEFAAVVSQEDAAYLFSESISEISVKIRGFAEQALDVTDQRIVPAQQKLLPSPALGWAAGGDVEIESTDGSGRTARESFFELVAHVDQTQLDNHFFHGQSGKIRCRLPAEPLASRGIRSIRQLMQRRFGL